MRNEYLIIVRTNNNKTYIYIEEQKNDDIERLIRNTCQIKKIEKFKKIDLIRGGLFYGFSYI